MTNKTLAFILAGFLLLTFFAGCGDDPESTATTTVTVSGSGGE